MSPPLLPDHWRALSVSEVPEEAIPEAIGLLERLQAELWVRLTRPEPNGKIASQPAEERYLMVQEVTVRLKVSRRWVLDHKRELGGFGTRKTLLFPERRLKRWEESHRR